MPLMQCPACAADLRHSITIESASESNVGGEVQRTWSTLVSARAKIEPLRGRELFNAAAITPEVTHKITLRYPGQTITPKMRVLFGSRYFGIEFVQNLEERNFWLVLMCKETPG